jgi:hypothetical protein
MPWWEAVLIGLSLSVVSSLSFAFGRWLGGLFLRAIHDRRLR